MTRINTIPVQDLMDQHLIAEYREITRISKLARPLDDYGVYKMGAGHVKFFYNKGKYLRNRTQELYNECIKRGFNVTYKEYQLHPEGLNKDWSPTNEDKKINLVRINEKLNQKPDFYRKTKHEE